jgi:hypothetical protein
VKIIQVLTSHRILLHSILADQQISQVLEVYNAVLIQAPQVVHHQVQLVIIICILVAIHLPLQLKMQQEIPPMIDSAGQYQLIHRRLVEYKQASKRSVYVRLQINC